MNKLHIIVVVAATLVCVAAQRSGRRGTAGVDSGNAIQATDFQDSALNLGDRKAAAEKVDVEAASRNKEQVAANQNVAASENTAVKAADGKKVLADNNVAVEEYEHVLETNNLDAKVNRNEANRLGISFEKQHAFNEDAALSTDTGFKAAEGLGFGISENLAADAFTDVEAVDHAKALEQEQVLAEAANEDLLNAQALDKKQHDQFLQVKDQGLFNFGAIGFSDFGQDFGSFADFGGGFNNGFFGGALFGRRRK